MSESRPQIDLCFENAVQAEREYQDLKWGGPSRHSWARWASILGAEYGEACAAIKRLEWPNVDRGSFDALCDLRSELIQVAAVCAAMIEQLDIDLDTV